MFNNVYKNKKVLITGHTGFKGSWLTTWLLKLNAEVVGLSKDIPTKPALFNELGLSSRIKHLEVDVRDLSPVVKIFEQEKPDFVFHLAAQSIVSVSYNNPVETVTTNTLGTMNILEALRMLNHRCIAVLITSDKGYDNVEWPWGYRETDRLGGKDVYSGSKGAAELLIKSYFHSFFSADKPVNFAVGRAGNVIGGGDWAKDRIVADCMRSWSSGVHVEIRNPHSTRPWQHVLEPLSGYLRLAQAVATNIKLHGEAFNFGPQSEQNRTVEQLLRDLGKHWGFTDVNNAYRIIDSDSFDEAGLLKLNCDKALMCLGWESNLNYGETIQMVANWYKTYYQEKGIINMYEFTLKQIDQYEQIARERRRIWAKESDPRDRKRINQWRYAH